MAVAVALIGRTRRPGRAGPAELPELIVRLAARPSAFGVGSRVLGLSGGLVGSDDFVELGVLAASGP